MLAPLLKKVGLLANSYILWLRVWDGYFLFVFAFFKTQRNCPFDNKLFFDRKLKSFFSFPMFAVRFTLLVHHTSMVHCSKIIAYIINENLRAWEGIMRSPLDKNLLVLEIITFWFMKISITVTFTAFTKFSS